MWLKDWLIPFVLMIVSSRAGAAPQGMSPIRHMNESYESASLRVHQRENYGANFGNRATPENVKQPLGNLDIYSIPELPSVEQVNAQFAYIRDTKFIDDSSLKFPRRISWLYPDDGCYVRAELAGTYLKQRGFVVPKKIFVFGNLHANTKNSRYGYVEWWYHVAVTYRVGQTAYVYDPAVNPQNPMTLEEWHRAVGGGGRGNAQYSVCNMETFDPGSACQETRPHATSSTIFEQLGFLESEWDRLIDLRRDPYQELGNNPPWQRN
ncbi:hypothetical protein D3C87_87780 [compost metagenome]